MKLVLKLSVGPEYIDDVSVLVDALYKLEDLENKTGQPHVFKYIQQRMLGGTCYAVPANSKMKENSGVRILGIYDKQFLKDRIEELSKY